jgi:hypothetical protein
MNESMLTIFTARIRFKASVPINALPPWYEAWKHDGAKEAADLIMAAMDAGNPTAICGVQWQDLYYALERVR